MPNLQIIVNNKVATYVKRGGAVVCGNSDYVIEFAFDQEWDAHESKVARFTWGGKYVDLPFTGSTCAVPVLRDTDVLVVGVYAGDLTTTTPAVIPCQRSILCGTGSPHDEDEPQYISAALAAAEEAKQAAEEAKQAAGGAVSGDVSNALKGTATGEAVRADGVSPLAHDMVVKVSGVEDASAVKVRAYGKNLFDISKVVTSSHNIETTHYGVINNGDDTITVVAESYFPNIAAGKPNTLKDYAPQLKVNETYTLSAETTGTGPYIRLIEAAKTWVFGRSLTITQEMLDSEVCFYANEVAGGRATVSNLQIEQGSTTTAPEPYIEPTEYAVNADGTVDGVAAIHPTTMLTTDTDGAVLDVEYNRDINQAFAELQQALLALI